MPSKQLRPKLYSLNGHKDSGLTSVKDVSKSLPLCQAQACGALADWLRHHPEYSNLAPQALENFNLASSFMSKVYCHVFYLTNKVTG